MSRLSQAQFEAQQKKDTKKWYSLDQEDIFKKLNSSKDGLSVEEVKKRQDKQGPNELPVGQTLSKWLLFFNQFKSSLVYVLLVAAIITLILGDAVDAGIIMLAVVINVIIGFYQENKANNALRALEKAVVHYARVLREGRKQQIKAKELVLGDIIFLESGDKIPADLRIFKSKNLKTNEAPLTGEADEVDKNNKIISGDLVLADQTNMAFMGTQVTQGTARGIVVAIGADTYLGQIATMVSHGEEILTPLQRKLNIFSRKISIIVLGISIFIFLVGILQGQGFTKIFATAVAVAVSAIPEGLLVVVTMILAIGMHRILEKGALAKNLLAAETLGSTSVICADKTGTLTEGEMRVAELRALDYSTNFLHTKSEKIEIFEEEKLFMLSIGAICNNAYVENSAAELEHKVIRGTPTEKALLLAADNIGISKDEVEREQPRLDEIPFDSEWKFMVTLNKENKKRSKIYIKGAPEILLDFSKFIYSSTKENKKIELDSDNKKKIMEAYEDMSKRGLRVIAVGYKNVDSRIIDLKGIDKDDFVFVGLIGIKDPIREGITESLRTIKQAGIKIVMITGDHKFTARTIAAELNLPHATKNILSGENLAKMSENELIAKVELISLYARVSPEDKLKIVKAWQEKGAVVAMTGDGINDAPALKRANIGITVGAGTDVAKETADVILLDNNFKTIAAAVKEGRVIYDNIKKVILYFLSDSFSEVLIITISLLLGWPLPLLAAQIIWINLVDDTFPALALTQETAEVDIMRQKPRQINEPILNNESKLLIGLISTLCALETLFLFNYFYTHFGNLDLARTVSFTFLAVSTLVYVFSIRNLRKPIWQTDIFNNHFLLGAVGIGFGLQLLAVYTPFLQAIFYTVSLGITEWTIILLACALLVILIEGVKMVYNNKIFK